jgi:serine/threonine protein kinase
MPVSVNDKLGQYEILSPIGAGGMGEVYRARTRLGREVALKILPVSTRASTAPKGCSGVSEQELHTQL